MSRSSHVPVMLKEFLHHFQDKFLKVFFDGTVGLGGHALALLEAHPEIEQYIGCDQDPTALKMAEETLRVWKRKLRLERGNFSKLDQYLEKNEIQQVDGFFLIWGCRLCN